MEKIWIDYQDWKSNKEWYEKIERDVPGLHEEIMEFTNNFIKEMSKRRNKKAVVEQPKLTEEQIKSIMELFKPNKFQLYVMKLFGVNAWFAGNKERVASLESILKLSPGEIYELEIKYYF